MIEVDPELGFELKALAGIGVNPALGRQPFPIGIRRPGVQAIRGRVPPQHRIGAIDRGRRNGLPVREYSFIDRITLDRDRIDQPINID